MTADNVNGDLDSVLPENEPDELPVCPTCEGWDPECRTCDGDGVIFTWQL